MTTPSAGTFYYHYDGLGSVTDLTNSTGVQQSEYKYEAFGDLRQDRNVAGAPDNKLKYTGEYHDEFTDTYHLRARQYDSHIGRFTQTDPQAARVGDPFVAAYVYVGNKPTRATDPSGAIEIDFDENYTIISVDSRELQAIAISGSSVAGAILGSVLGSYAGGIVGLAVGSFVGAYYADIINDYDISALLLLDADYYVTDLVDTEIISLCLYAAGVEVVGCL